MPGSAEFLSSCKNVYSNKLELLPNNWLWGLILTWWRVVAGAESRYLFSSCPACEVNTWIKGISKLHDELTFCQLAQQASLWYFGPCWCKRCHCTIAHFLNVRFGRGSDSAVIIAGSLICWLLLVALLFICVGTRWGASGGSGRGIHSMCSRGGCFGMKVSSFFFFRKKACVGARGGYLCGRVSMCIAYKQINEEW